MTVDRAPTKPPIDDEALDRAQVALCRFVFPGLFVPRHEMARAVLMAAADTSDNWMSNLPARRIVDDTG